MSQAGKKIRQIVETGGGHGPFRGLDAPCAHCSQSKGASTPKSNPLQFSFLQPSSSSSSALPGLPFSEPETNT